jgi:hypothetical protein
MALARRLNALTVRTIVILRALPANLSMGPDNARWAVADLFPIGTTLAITAASALKLLEHTSLSTETETRVTPMWDQATAVAMTMLAATNSSSASSPAVAARQIRGG